MTVATATLEERRATLLDAAQRLVRLALTAPDAVYAGTEAGVDVAIINDIAASWQAAAGAQRLWDAIGYTPLFALADTCCPVCNDAGEVMAPNYGTPACDDPTVPCPRCGGVS